MHERLDVGCSNHPFLEILSSVKEVGKYAFWRASLQPIYFGRNPQLIKFSHGLFDGVMTEYRLRVQQIFNIFMNLFYGYWSQSNTFVSNICLKILSYHQKKIALPQKKSSSQSNASRESRVTKKACCRERRKLRMYSVETPVPSS